MEKDPDWPDIRELPDELDEELSKCYPAFAPDERPFPSSFYAP